MKPIKTKKTEKTNILQEMNMVRRVLPKSWFFWFFWMFGEGFFQNLDFFVFFGFLGPYRVLQGAVSLRPSNRKNESGLLIYADVLAVL